MLRTALTSAAAPDPEPSQCTPFPLASLGSLDDEHVLLLGDPGAELMCALFRAGACQVTHLRCSDRLEPDSASLVLVPRLPSLAWLASALPPIRRALYATGRLVLGAEDTGSISAQQIRRLLLQTAFVPVRSSRFGGGLLVQAERPMLSLRRVA